MIRKKILCILLILPVFFSCNKTDEDNTTVKIGFSAASDTFLLERWDRDIKIFMAAAREHDAEVIFAKSPGNAMGQIPQIQYLLEQNIDVLVVIPEDMEMLSGIIKKIVDKGIPVLSYDRPIMNVPITGYVSFDNKEVGRLLAGALISEVPNGKYLIVNGSIRDNNSYEVNKGIHEVLDPYLMQGEISLVEEIWLDEWSFDEATKKIGDVLAETQDIQAISAANDMIAEAAIRLLSERRLAGQVAVVGQDADLLSCQRVMEGTQLITVYKPIALLAERAALLAVNMARKEAPEPEQYMDNNSGREIPFYVETPIAVDKELMDDTVIKDGFHSKDDVYRKINL